MLLFCSDKIKIKIQLRCPLKPQYASNEALKCWSENSGGEWEARCPPIHHKNEKEKGLNGTVTVQAQLSAKRGAPGHGLGVATSKKSRKRSPTPRRRNMFWRSRPALAWGAEWGQIYRTWLRAPQLLVIHPVLPHRLAPSGSPIGEPSGPSHYSAFPTLQCWVVVQFLCIREGEVNTCDLIRREITNSRCILKYDENNYSK